MVPSDLGTPVLSTRFQVVCNDADNDQEVFSFSFGDHLLAAGCKEQVLFSSLIMASYVFNNNYLKNGLADEACSFNNNTALTSINPSQGTCRYHSSKRVSNGRVADDNFNGCRTSRYERWLTGFQQLYLVGFFTNSEPRRDLQWKEKNIKLLS
ncbi:hypothetical protein Bca4012_064416 [Brassica carinata]